jgi:AcrR family transcriptional regulator
VSHREDLLEAAIRCLYEKGYARTTARDLVAESGTNLGSIGYHFGSKERLMDEALMVAFHRWLDPIVEQYLQPGPETLVERFRDGVADFVDSLERNRPLVVACFEALAQVERSSDLRRDLAASYEDWRRAMGEGIERLAGAEQGEGRAIASLVMAISDGFMIQWLLDPASVPELDRVVADAVKLVPLALGEAGRTATG